jgi:predicted nucleic acid-binding Zn ribbon protein
MVDELKGVLQSVWKDMLARQTAQATGRLEEVWAQTVGPQAAAHARITQLTNKRIHVNVDSSAWLHELTLKKKTLLAALKNVSDIDEIVLKIGPVSSGKSA